MRTAACHFNRWKWWLTPDWRSCYLKALYTDLCLHQKDRREIAFHKTFTFWYFEFHLHLSQPGVCFCKPRVCWHFMSDMLELNCFFMVHHFNRFLWDGILFRFKTRGSFSASRAGDYAQFLAAKCADVSSKISASVDTNTAGNCLNIWLIIMAILTHFQMWRRLLCVVYHIVEQKNQTTKIKKNTGIYQGEVIMQLHLFQFASERV